MGESGEEKPVCSSPQWHEMKELQLGPSRLQVQLRSSATPLGPAKERRKVKFFGGEDSQELKTGVSNGQ